MEVVDGQHDLTRLPADPHHALSFLLALVLLSLDGPSDLLQLHLLLVEQGIRHQDLVLFVLPESIIIMRRQRDEVKLGYLDVSFSRYNYRVMAHDEFRTLHVCPVSMKRWGIHVSDVSLKISQGHAQGKYWVGYMDKGKIEFELDLSCQEGTNIVVNSFVRGSRTASKS